ncbi:MAG: DNA cytosine methyltransferase [Dokdonella sp.]|uniref:DNA cytosine methyltransferase n=1 Tax=Dokdonella sp. TaxID=2291710 RepID=UPI0025B82FA9|nr:DNA cytosine methyltransferase [Dokdonella sp.]MBK8123945.1 DNA cytosine methyltransferase [Dokdonella sp.]
MLTTDGYKPIETVAVGDLVLTHQGRFRAVLEVGSDVAECVVVKGQGHHGLVCTPGHPFLVGNDEWCEAKDLKGRRWANVAQVPEVPVPAMVPTAKGHFYDKASKGYRVKGDKGGKPVYVGLFGTVEEAAAARTEAIRDGRIDVRGANAADVWSPGFARFLGYWIGDGWVSRDHVFLCGAVGDADLLEQLFAGAKLLGKATLEPTSSRIRCGSKHFVRWLREQFGEYAHGKKIPAWLYGMPEEYRRAFLDGYLLADGHEETGKRGGGRVRVFTTVSKALAIGVRVLLNQLGASASIRVINNQRQAVIDGRPVSERPSYKVTAYETVRSFRLLGRHGWGLVRSVEPAGTHTVYNLAVDEDESYTADGIVVHNCQPFSTAGKQRGCEDDRHLWPTFFRLIRECRPASVFGEQVAGINGLAWIDHVFADLEDEDYAVGAADLPACGAGAPHRRQRLFWVANANSNERRATQGYPYARTDWRNDIGGRGDVDLMGNSDITGLEGRSNDTPEYSSQRAVRPSSPWGQLEWLTCSDGKSRPSQPGIFPLVDGIPKGLVRCGNRSMVPDADQSAEARTMRLKGYGNAIVPQVAAIFITAAMQSL